MRLHRWLGWLVGLQVLAWMLGGLVFAWLPFEPWVKGHELARAPQLELPADWAQRLTTAGTPPTPLTGLHAVATPHGSALKVRNAEGVQWLRLDGQSWQAPSADAVGAFARGIYQGSGRLLDVQKLDRVPTRLLMVQETGGRRGLWRARFDDALRTRLYFDGESGEYLLVRTEAWVWFDFFWRLHIMDWGEGHDFNTPWLRGVALAALALTLAGLGLSWLALRRARKRARIHP